MRGFFSCKAHIGGATIFCECEGGFFGLFVIRGYNNNHIWQCAHERDVFKHLMSGAIGANGDSGMCTDDFNVAIIVADSCSNLFPATAGAEAGVGGGEGDFSCGSKARCDGDEILFGNADFNELLGVFFSKGFNSCGFS